jgi:hypothetical protein
MPLKTITANEFHTSGSAQDKFPHTGPIYYGTGSRPYLAALKGITLKTRGGIIARCFKSADAAERAINGVRPL